MAPKPLPGLWRWLDWLPVSKPNNEVAGSICYRSKGLAQSLELKNLWISFNGYWPERGANCPTTTFKDMEAEHLFTETEGIDPLSPASVAIASLKQACASGEVDSGDCILLNVSGGGRKRHNEEIKK